MIERDVKQQVRILLMKYGWFQWMPPSNAFGRVGIADINAVSGGRFLAIETKVGTNVPSPMQRIFLGNVRGAGGWAFTINETRIADLKRWFDLHAQGADGEEFDALTATLSVDPVRKSRK
jgi:hypothetical protein